jgi:hypothetical protein
MRKNYGRNDVQITVKYESYMLSKERNALKPLSSDTIASFNEYMTLLKWRALSLRRAFFSLALLIWIWYYTNNSLLHQVGHNPLEFQDIDPTYWILMWLNLPGLLNGSGAYIIDGLLLVSCVGSILYVKQMITTRLFFCCSFLYFVYYNLWSGHHYINTGLFLMSFPFIFSNHFRFKYCFVFCRLLFCSMLVIAALWKIARGSLWHIDQALLYSYCNSKINCLK